MPIEKKELKPLTKMEFLQTLRKNVIGSNELDSLYNDYLSKFYGYRSNKMIYACNL